MLHKQAYLPALAATSMWAETVACTWTMGVEQKSGGQALSCACASACAAAGRAGI